MSWQPIEMYRREYCVHAKLSKVDQEFDVICYTEESELLALGHMFRRLEIYVMDVNEDERNKDGNEAPMLKLGKSPNSATIALIGSSLNRVGKTR